MGYYVASGDSIARLQRYMYISWCCRGVGRNLDFKKARCGLDVVVFYKPDIVACRVEGALGRLVVFCGVI